MDRLKNLLSLIEKYKKESEYLSRLNIIMGNNIHEELVKKLNLYGNKFLFCTGNTAMHNLGFVKKYKALFKEYGLNAIHYDNISSNPTLKQMVLGINIAKETNPDFIFALGGGSVIDTAKVISVGIYGDIWGFVEGKSTIGSSIPIIASSTTSGTGSHITPYAVITNTDTLEKKTLKSPCLLPKLSIVDVDITKFVPRYIVATTGFDVLCHASEVYTRLDCSEAAKEFAKRALILLKEHLISSYQKSHLRDKIGMALADLYAGIALSLVGTHLPHAISHPISARFPLINHGQSLAYVMAETSRKQTEKSDENLRLKFEEMSILLGGNGNFVETINHYTDRLDLKKKLKKFNGRDINLIIKDTLGYRKPSVERSPVELSEEDIKIIINNSLSNCAF